MIYYPQYLIWWFIVDQQVYYLYFGYTILGIFCWTVAVEMMIAAAAPTDIIAIGRTKNRAGQKHPKRLEKGESPKTFSKNDNKFFFVDVKK